MGITLKHRINQLECVIDFLANFRTRENDLAANEDQKHNLGLDHTIDETREQLRLIRAKVVMATGQSLESNWELDVTRSNNVLDLEVGKLGIEAKFLDDTRILP